MIVDVNVKQADDAFLEDIDEIIEDTMVHLFVLGSTNHNEFIQAKEYASQHNPLYYYAPLSAYDHTDEKCLGYIINDQDDINRVKDKVLYIDEKELTTQLIFALVNSNAKGIILNATKSHPDLHNFYLSINPSNIDNMSEETVASISMDKIVLESTYPHYDFSEIFETSKKISDKNFRPDQSIIAQATKNSLMLFGFKKS